MNDGTLVIHGEETTQSVGSVGVVVHPSVAHLVDFHKILSSRLAIRHLFHIRQKLSSIINCYSLTLATDESELDAPKRNTGLENLD
ncbi:hypothetical protein RB195_007060 [Necator americanus]